MAIRYKPDTANKIFLGRQGENLAREYAFDFSTWRERYGEGAISLIAQRFGDAAPYPVAITVEGDTAIWTVTNADTAVVGTGKCELRYTVDDVIVKSATYKTKVTPSLSGELKSPPAPQTGWVTKVLTAREEAVGAADRAKDYAIDAERSNVQAQEAQREAEAAAEEAAKTAEETAEKTAEAALSELRPILDDLNAHRYDAFATETQTGNFAMYTDVGADDVPLKQLIARNIGGAAITNYTVRRLGKNLFNPSVDEFVVGQRINDDGYTTSDSTVAYSKNYTPVLPNTDYVFSGRVNTSAKTTYIVFYDSQKTFMYRYDPGHTGPCHFKTPKDCHFIRYNVRSNTNFYKEVQLEIGTTATDFEAYSAKDFYVNDETVKTAKGVNYFFVLSGTREEDPSWKTYTLDATLRLDPTLIYEKLKTAIVAAGTT